MGTMNLIARLGYGPCGMAVCAFTLGVNKQSRVRQANNSCNVLLKEQIVLINLKLHSLGFQILKFQAHLRIGVYLG